MGRKKILVWRPYASLGAIARSRKPDVWFALFSLSNTHTKPPKNEEKILSQDSVFVVTPPLDVAQNPEGWNCKGKKSQGKKRRVIWHGG